MKRASRMSRKMREEIYAEQRRKMLAVVSDINAPVDARNAAWFAYVRTKENLLPTSHIGEILESAGIFLILALTVGTALCLGVQTLAIL